MPEAAQTTEAAAPAEAATHDPAAKPADTGAAKPADAKPVEAAKPAEEQPKQPWRGALAAERKAREAQASARKAQQAAETKAKEAEDRATARIAELEGQAKQIAPLLEALKSKDPGSLKKLMADFNVSMVDIARQVAEEGKPPTVEEIEARATAQAKSLLEAELKKRDDAAAEAAKKADEARAREAQEDKDRRFVSAVTRELEGATELLGSAEHADKYALANALDKVLPAIGLDKGSTDMEWGEGADGSPLTVTVKGGSPIARAAVSLSLKIMHATASEKGGPTRISMAEAIDRVQKAALTAEPRLQQLTGLPTSDGKTDKKNDQKKNGGAAQPTLSTRATTGPVVDAVDEDRGSLVDERAVRKAALAALPHLRQHFAD